mgnify:CR=1 FL=1
MWAVTVECFPHQKRRDQRRTIGHIKLHGEPGARPSPYEMADGEERVRMIGNALHAAGERWTRTHAAQLEWLREQGVTPQQATEKYLAWREDVDARTFTTKGLTDGVAGHV